MHKHTQKGRGAYTPMSLARVPAQGSAGKGACDNRNVGKGACVGCAGKRACDACGGEGLLRTTVLGSLVVVNGKPAVHGHPISFTEGVDGVVDEATRE